MTSRHPNLAPRAVLLLLAALPSPLAAQATTASTATNEPAVQLSPFTVVSDRDVGYRAQNTLSGSRLNSSLADTPAVLDVLTKEFLDDVGVTTLEQALNFSANYETTQRAVFER